MTLDDACSAFEGLFGAVKVDPELPSAATIICSGALGLPDRPPPILCANRELAVALWSRCARDHALDCLITGNPNQEAEPDHEQLKRLVLTWVTEPQMLQFKMTIQDQVGGQRVATTRFAVYSLCAISEQPQDVVSGEPKCLTTPRGAVKTGRRGKGGTPATAKARSKSASSS